MNNHTQQIVNKAWNFAHGEIADDLQTALDQFAAIAAELKSTGAAG